MADSATTLTASFAIPPAVAAVLATMTAALRDYRELAP